MNGAVQGLATTVASSPESSASACSPRARMPPASACSPMPIWNTPLRFKRQHEEQHRQAADDHWGLELISPAQTRAASAQASSSPAMAQNDSTTPRANSSPCVRSLRGIAVRLLRYAQHFDREDREHAGHQVEQQTAAECEQQRRGEAEAGRGARARPLPLHSNGTSISPRAPRRSPDPPPARRQSSQLADWLRRDAHRAAHIRALRGRMSASLHWRSRLPAGEELQPPQRRRAHRLPGRSAATACRRPGTLSPANLQAAAGSA